MIPMDQKEAMEYRVDKAVEISENFSKLHTERLKLIQHHYGKPFLLSLLYFKIWHYTRQVTKFEREMIKIIEALKSAEDFMTKHECIWDFNDHLANHKDMLIEYYNFSANWEDNEGETIFNVYTYGGTI